MEDKRLSPYSTTGNIEDNRPAKNRILARIMAHELTTEELTEISGGRFMNVGDAAMMQ
jgi:bacteriocin-like protein